MIAARFLLTLVAAMLVGCLHTQGGSVSAANAAVEPLAKLATLNLAEVVSPRQDIRGVVVKHVAYLPDGSGVGIHVVAHEDERKVNYALIIDARTFSPRMVVNVERVLGLDQSADYQLINVGFISSGMYFAATSSELFLIGTESNEIVGRYPGNYQSGSYNGDMILGADGVLHLEGGKIVPADAAGRGVPEITPQGWIVDSGHLGEVLRIDSKTGKSDAWHSGFKYVSAFPTTSDRFVIAASDGGRCTSWRMPEKKPVGECDRRASHRNHDTVSAYAVHPIQERFAVAWRMRVQVYDVEPWKKIADLEMDKDVVLIAFHSTNKLITVSSGNFGEDAKVQVWGLDSQRLLHETRQPDVVVYGRDQDGIIEFLNPKAPQLAVIREDARRTELIFYALPE